MFSNSSTPRFNSQCTVMMGTASRSMNLESFIRFLSKPYLDYSKPVIKGGAIPIIWCKEQVEGEIATSLLSIVEALSRFNFHALQLLPTVRGIKQEVGIEPTVEIV